MTSCLRRSSRRCTPRQAAPEGKWDQLLQWIKDTRHKYYVNGLAAPDKQDEPIQPLPSAMHVDAKKAALGQKLFNDVRLSGDKSMSCATCHDFTKAGTDGVMIAQGVYDLNSGLNTPTVFNAVFNFRQYWNGRAADVQEAAKLAPLDPTMMPAAARAGISFSPSCVSTRR